MRKENVYQIDNDAFIKIVKTSKNIHESLIKMGLNSRGAAYKTFKLRCKKLKLDLSHFKSEKDIRKLILDENIIVAIKHNISRQSTLKVLNLNPHSGSNVKWINKKIENLNINIDHWVGQGHLKNKTHNWADKKALDEILIENSDYLWTANLKKRLLKEELLNNNCYSCGINEWLGQKLSLQLEHKNGNNTDNRIENLCLLCPNCHSLTETYAGKNIGRQGGTRTHTE